MKNLVWMILFLLCRIPLYASEIPKLNRKQKICIDRSRRTARRRVNKIRIDLKLSSSKDVGQFFVDRLQLSPEQIGNLIRTTEASRLTSDSYARTAKKVQELLTQEQMEMIFQLIQEYPFLTPKETSCIDDASSTSACVIIE